MEEFVVSTGSGVTAGEGLDTYAGLIGTIGDWLDRYDLAAKAPNFVALLEARLNRELRCPEMESTATLQNTVGTPDEEAYRTFDLPADFLQLRALRNDEGLPLEQVSLDTLRKFYTDQEGEAAVFAIVGGTALVAPRPADSTLLYLEYYARIESLSDEVESNWVLESHPDIYLFGSLTMAEAFLANDERIGLWKSASDEAIEQLKSQGAAKRHGGPLSARARSVA